MTHRQKMFENVDMNKYACKNRERKFYVNEQKNKSSDWSVGSETPHFRKL